MILCPANGVDTFAQFNGNDGAYNAGAVPFIKTMCSLTAQPNQPLI